MTLTGGLSVESCFPDPGCAHHCVRITLLCLILLTPAACRKAEEPLSHDAIIQADLKEILELQGFSCDEVVKFEVGDRLDFRVECQSGEQYRIRVSSEGQVRAEQKNE